ncbi:putative bifunctional diguanylate cyclase/phosphodiesterase [Cryptosporangium aurantiacum]|uniref:Diguanylate cyclase (GGDEF) domain-containing protein n=1 Tax=Cryptosporangium aurantiacum TaxID=134849 RepID=A0A1M7I0F9_9ACTN|nr:EAL domain-containing protein [Cryptosporangium aurantiacum]SHM34200.1 diguanylate cyclase (GGDEF) domain-containing protein [Cryptosporangium aurantiacum]
MPRTLGGLGPPLLGGLPPLCALPLLPTAAAVAVYTVTVVWLIATVVSDQAPRLRYATPGAPMVLVGIGLTLVSDGFVASLLADGERPDPLLVMAGQVVGLLVVNAGLIRVVRRTHGGTGRGGLIDATVVVFGIGTSIATIAGSRVVDYPTEGWAQAAAALLAVASLLGWGLILRLLLASESRTETGLLVGAVGLLLLSGLVWWGPLFGGTDPRWALAVVLGAGTMAAAASRWWALHTAGQPTPAAVGWNTRMPLFLLAVVAPPTALTVTALRAEELGRWSGVVLPVAGMAVLSIALLLRVHQQARDSERRALRDTLTGLANRAALTDALDALAPSGRPALLLLDLDGFKAVNDGFGHPAGDALLRQVAARVSGTVAAVTGAGVEAVAARLGGDEFAVLLHPADTETTAELGRRLVDAVAAPYPIDGRELCVTVSVGIRAEAGEIAVLLRDADLALYAAKQNGKNQVAVFSAALRAAHAERATLAAGLHQAVARNEFVLHYQPVVDVVTGRAEMIEALIRWAPPGGDLVLSRDFFAVAEAAGLSVPIGAWVLPTACAEARRWHERYGVSLAVNVSERQLRDPALPALVADALAESGLPAEALILEMTESTMSGMSGRTATLAARVAELRACGVRVAVDDFGTGQSSLALLRQLPVDALKLDPALGGAADLSAAPDAAAPDAAAATLVDAALTRAVLQICSTLNLRAIAERVESADRVEWLRALGCRYMQGNYFSPPLPAERVDEYLATRPARVMPEVTRTS